MYSNHQSASSEGVSISAAYLIVSQKRRDKKQPYGAILRSRNPVPVPEAHVELSHGANIMVNGLPLPGRVLSKISHMDAGQRKHRVHHKAVGLSDERNLDLERVFEPRAFPFACHPGTCLLDEELQ